MSGLVLALDVETRTCERCGCFLVRKRGSSGRPESATGFAKRKFCSRACWPTEEDRFAKKVRRDPASACLIWTGSRNNHGYGQIRIRGRLVLAHRVAYERAHGPLPDGLNALHSCDTPACVEPAHLHPGTPHDNAMEKVARRRDRNSRKTTCPRGHRYDDENTYVLKGWRYCRRCRANRPALSAAAKSAGVRIVEVPA